MQPGVDIEISKNQKDEVTLTGNSLEGVSQSAADIQQICRVKNKDIRKVNSFAFTKAPPTDGNSSLTACTSQSGVTSRRRPLRELGGVGWCCADGLCSKGLFN